MACHKVGHSCAEVGLHISSPKLSFLILFAEKVYLTKGFKGQGNAPYPLRAEKVLGVKHKKRAVAKIATALYFPGAERGI